jgi:hypothetical protein
MSCVAPSITQSALKILWRQCSELAWANIISSTSVGLRPSLREGVDQVVDFVVGQGQAQLAVGLRPARRGPASTSTVASGCGA